MPSRATYWQRQHFEAHTLPDAIPGVKYRLHNDTSLNYVLAISLGVIIAVSAIIPASGQLDREFLDIAEYTHDNGQITLWFTQEFDLDSLYLNRISIHEGNDTLTLSATILGHIGKDSITFNLGESDQDILSGMVSPTIRVGEGAISVNGISISMQELPLSRIIPIGVVDPHNDIISMAEVSADHFNSMLAQQEGDWRIRILHETGGPVESLIKLKQAGAVAVVGHQDVLSARSQADYQSIVVACCTDSIEDHLYAVDPAAFSLTPGNTDALDAMLSVMADRGVNRIYPIYPDTGAGRAVYDYIRLNAQSAVDDGIRYDTNMTTDTIAAPLAALIDANLQASTGARPGIVIANPEDATTILSAVATEPTLREDRVHWVGTGISDDSFEGILGVVAEVTNYAVPVAGSPHSGLGAILTSADQDEVTENVPSPIQNTRTYGAYDAIQLIAYTLSGYATGPLYPTAPVDTISHDIVTGSAQLQEVLRHNSELYSGLTGYAGLGPDGGLGSPVHDIMGIRGEQWVRLGVNNHPNSVGLHMIFVNNTILQIPQYIPGDGDIHDVVHVGLVTHLAQTADLRAAAGVALDLVNQDAIKQDKIVDAVIIRGTQNAAFRLGSFSNIGANPIVVHMPGVDDSDYSGTRNTIISTSAAHPGTINDDIIRLAPPQAVQAQALAQIMEQDDIHGVAAVFRQDSPSQYLVEQLADEFSGEINTEVSYDERVEYDRLALPLLGAVLNLKENYDASNIGVLIADDANIQDAIRNTLEYYQVRSVPWYGTLSSAGVPGLASSISGLVDDTHFTGLAPALLDGGLSGGILDSLKDLGGSESPPYLALLLESVRLAGTVRAEAGSNLGSVKDAAPEIAASLDGFMIDSLRLDASGNLESDVYDIWTVRDDMWFRDETYDIDYGYKEKIRIGLALPLTGPDAQSGITHLYAAYLAVQKFNDLQTDDKHRLSLSVADIGGGAAQAVAELQNQGVSIILGLPDTPSLKDAQSAADTSTLLISCCSDDTSLARIGDNILRTIPDQTVQLTPLVASMNDTGISHLVVLHTAESPGDALIESLPEHLHITKQLYQDATGIDMLNDTIGELSDAHGTESVGVLIVSYPDTASILAAAYQHNRDVLSAKWFGVSADGQRPDITENLDAMKAAYRSGFEVAAPIALPRAATIDLQNDIHDATGTMPSRDALATYDAILLIGDTLENLEGPDIPIILSAILPNNQITGVTGALQMNSNGDLVSGYYGIWRGDGERWYEAGTRLVSVP